MKLFGGETQQFRKFFFLDTQTHSMPTIQRIMQLSRTTAVSTAASLPVVVQYSEAGAVFKSLAPLPLRRRRRQSYLRHGDHAISFGKLKISHMKAMKCLFYNTIAIVWLINY
jgi:hypothetical protein